MLFKNKHNWKTPRKQYSSEFPGLIFASTIPDSELKESEKPEIPMGAHKTTKRTTVKACSPGKKQAAQQQKTFTEKKKKKTIKYHRKKLAQPPPLLADWMGTWVVHPHQDIERPPPQLLQSPWKTNGEHELPLPPGRNNQPILLRCGVVSEGNLWRVNAFTSTRNKVTTPVLSVVNFLGNKTVSVEA